MKLDHKVTKEERGLLASLEIWVRLVPLDLKGTEVMRVLRALRASEEPQDLLVPPETQDSWVKGVKMDHQEMARKVSPASLGIQATEALLG